MTFLITNIGILSTCFAALMCQTFGTVETFDDKPYL